MSGYQRLGIAWILFFAPLGMDGSTTVLGQPQFWFDALPELPGGASSCFQVVDSTSPLFGFWRYSIGQALDGDGINKAVVWTKPQGQPWQIEVLPNPFGNTESSGLSMSRAAAILDIPPYCVGGLAHNANGFPQPLVWSGDGVGPWTAEVPPLPPGFDSGAILASFLGHATHNHWHFSGWVEQSEGPEPHHAAAWTKDLQNGLWAVELLPDYGPGFASEANTAIQVPDETTPIEFISGGHVHRNRVLGTCPAFGKNSPAGSSSASSCP